MSEQLGIGVLTLCRTTSNGPWPERGRCWSISTNRIPFFLHTHLEENSAKYLTDSELLTYILLNY